MLSDLFGKYRLLERVACGGTAEIYRAVKVSSNGFEKRVAIKRLLPTYSDNDEMRELLFDEARVLTSLEHRSIVQVLDYDAVDGVPFIAMEFVDGIDCGFVLQRLMEKKTRMPPMHVMYIASCVLQALDFAHEAKDSNGSLINVVHRDISPSNILLSWHGDVKLIDFGIAGGSHRSRRTSAGVLRGKYSYMSPEQAAGEKPGSRSDIYSTALIIVELLTGKRVLSGKSDMEILNKAERSDISKEVLKAIPEKLLPVIMPALSIDPKRRYRSAGAFLKDLREASKILGDISSGVGFAGYLRENFSVEYTRREKLILKERKRKTKVMQIPKCNVDEVKGRKFKIFKIAVAAFVAFIALSVSPYDGEKNASAVPIPETKKTIPSNRMLAGRKSGTVVIDSIPKGADVLLTIGERKIEFKTPFTISDLNIDEALNGNVELTMKGYKGVSDTFRLTENFSTFVKNFSLKPVLNARLHVQAMPWGLVDIPGYMKGRETPVYALTISPGMHTVRVKHPPTGRSISRRISFPEGKQRRCVASFGDEPYMSCK